MPTKDTFVFDLDGTLRDLTHRLPLLPKENLHLARSWDEFNLACGGDVPIPDNIQLINALYGNLYQRVVILTGCNGIARETTMDWLERHDVRYDGLFMRPFDCDLNDVAFKDGALREIGLDRIICCFDDNPKVIAHMRSMGLTVHDVVGHKDVSERADLHGTHGTALSASNEQEETR